MEDGANKGAEHVLTHGTPRAHAAADKAGYKSAGKNDSAAGDGGAHGEKKLSHVEIHPDSKGPGRHIVHKHHKPHHLPEHDEMYSVGDQAAMHAHLDEHLPESGGAGEDEGAREEMAEEQAADRAGGAAATA